MTPNPAAARHYRSAGACRGAGAGDRVGEGAGDRAQRIAAAAQGRARPRARRDPPPLRSRRQRGAGRSREQSFLIDQLIRGALRLRRPRSVYPLANPDPGRAAGDGRGRRLRPRRAGARSPTSICCSCCPTSRRRGASRWSSSCSTCCGTWASRSARPRAPSTSACATRAADLTIRTALLEARYIWGDSALFARAEAALRREIVARHGRAVRRGQARRARRAPPAQSGDSRYLLEPNVKEGKGGLRDLHTLFWIAKYLYRVDERDELVEHGVLTAEECALPKRARTSSGPCAATSTISPAAPRSA